MAKRKSSQKQSLSFSNSKESGYRIRIFTWLIFGLGLALYANTLFHNYVLDDAIVIYDNEFTTKGMAGIPDLLKYDTFRGFFKVEGKDKLVAGGRYRPLTPLMYAIEVQLFAPVKKDENGLPVLDANGSKVFDPNEGGKLNAVKFVGHLVNVLLFALTGVVLFWLLLRMLTPEGGKLKTGGYAVFVALVAALLFVVHPIHSEAVANIKGRDEILTLLGSLGALCLSFLAYHEKRNYLNVIAAIVFFLALLSKENAITFLAVVPLSYYFFTYAKAKKIVTQTLPFVLAAALFLGIRGSILGWGVSGELPRELMNNPFLKIVGGQYVDFSSGEKFGTIFYTLGKYIQLLVFPHPLSHDYYPRVIDILNFSDWKVLLSVVLHIALGLYALIRLPKKDPLSYGILFYFATLSIVSNFVFPIGTTMNERFIYMPSVGFFIIVAVFLYRLTGSWGRPSKITIIGISALFLLLAGKTFVRNFDWKDNFTLFTTDVKVSKNSAKLRNAVGGELIHQAIKPENAARKVQMIQEATVHLKEALNIHPGYANPRLLLGNAYYYLDQFDTSVQYYQLAMSAEANYSEAQNNLFITYRDGGRYFGEKQGDLNKALEYLQAAHSLKPDDFETMRLLGVAYGVAQDNLKAIEYFTKALALKPEDASTLYNLGSAYYNAGNPEQGLFYIQKAKEIDPNIESERGGSN